MCFISVHKTSSKILKYPNRLIIKVFVRARHLQNADLSLLASHILILLFMLLLLFLHLPLHKEECKDLFYEDCQVPGLDLFLFFCH